MKKFNPNMLYIFSLVIATMTLSSCEEDLELIEGPVETSQVLKAGVVIAKANYYVSPTGSDSNPGTFEKPFKNWDKVISVVKPGDLVYLRGGIYSHSTKDKGSACYLVGKSGLAGSYIKFWAYPGETPILDCKNKPLVSGQGIFLTGNYWHIKGIEVINMLQGYSATNTSTVVRGITIKNSSNNIFENIKIHNIQGIGMGMTENSTQNLIKNSDFYDNYDQLTINYAGVPYHGGNADGVHLRAYKGSTNTIKGCRFYNNSDDGLDLWENEGTMTIDSCWSFKNGRDRGDGNGFKLGRTIKTKELYPQRLVYHCISYGNKAMGFDQNDANVTMVFYNNIAFANKGMGYYLAKFNLKNIIRNNVSLSNGFADNFTAESSISNNSWNGYAISTSSFVSVNSAELLYQRKANGNLPDISFLVPSTSSVLIDKGKNVGLLYKGVAPDIGVFETR